MYAFSEQQATCLARVRPGRCDLQGAVGREQYSAGMGHDIPTGLIPILVDAIAAHCEAADQNSNPAGVTQKAEQPG